MSSSKKQAKAASKAKSSTKKTVKIKVPRPHITVVAGKGDYRPTRFNTVRGNGDYLGDFLGGLGKKVGNTAQSMFRDITGFGDYRDNGPKSNSLLSMVGRAADTRSTSMSGPSVNPFEMGAMSVKFGGSAPRVQHREFVGPILASGSTAFTTQVFQIQPGLSGSRTLFPWGSSVAQCFRQYQLHGMILEYVTTSTNYAANSALGSVSMSTVYDAERSPLSNLAEVDNNEFTTSAAPSVSFYHPIECAPASQATLMKYVAKSNSVSGTDARFDDVGTFQISQSGVGVAAGVQIGELWCSYDIEFFKAELPDLHAGTTAVFSAANGSWDAGMLAPVPNPNNSLPVTISGGVFQMPRSYNGNYIAVCIYHLFAGTGTLNANLISYGSEITPLQLLPYSGGVSSSTYYCGTGIANAATGICAFTFSTIAETSGAANSFKFTCTSQVGTVGNTRVFVLPLDNDIKDANSTLADFIRKNPMLGAFAAMFQENSSSSSMSPPSDVPPAQPHTLGVACSSTQHQVAATSQAAPPPPPSPVVDAPVDMNTADSSDDSTVYEGEEYVLTPPPSVSLIMSDPRYANVRRLILNAAALNSHHV